MAQTGRPAKEIVGKKGLVQVTDESAIKSAALTVLHQCSKEVDDYKNGKTQLFGFFVGQVMKATQGKANPKIVNEILKDLLGE
ncbi:MAG: Asp-tRNA(Asn)/Glu-tRNA(Gln) amidotransferase GatCAB subunit B, partial [Desulfobacteraceae bacterium]|nr:Asp-tRNA(Asn)/Glu-tRNA(Gln) amidotransferase GatCAB subunit B [Desulfobacteraceae bacterium]